MIFSRNDVLRWNTSVIETRHLAAEMHLTRLSHSVEQNEGDWDIQVSVTKGTGTRVSTSYYTAGFSRAVGRGKRKEETLNCFLRSPLSVLYTKLPRLPAISSHLNTRLLDINLREVLGEAGDNVLELGLEVLGKGALLVEGVEEGLLVGAEVRKEVSLPLEDLGNGDVVEVTVDTSEDERNHLVDGHGLVLLLLEELSETLTTVEGLLGGGIEIGTELGEGGNLTVLGQEELEGTSDLLHGLELSGGADTRHRETDVDGRADTLVEELGLQEDLTISDGNDVGGNVSGHITTLGLNDGERSERSTTELVAHLGGTLEETRVEVEDVTGVGLTSRRATEKEGHLTVGDGLLGQIVVDDDGVLSVITEPLTCLMLAIGSQQSSHWQDSLPMEVPVNGAIYWRGAASEAVAATMMEYFMASFSSRVWTS